VRYFFSSSPTISCFRRSHTLPSVHLLTQSAVSLLSNIDYGNSVLYIHTYIHKEYLYRAYYPNSKSLYALRSQSAPWKSGNVSCWACGTIQNATRTYSADSQTIARQAGLPVQRQRIGYKIAVLTFKLLHKIHQRRRRFDCSPNLRCSSTIPLVPRQGSAAAVTSFFAPAAIWNSFQMAVTVLESPSLVVFKSRL